MKLEFSAGGIVFKKQETRNKKQILVLVAQHSGHHGWIFPKGHIGDTKKNETKEEAALREVKEETGVVAKILKPLPPVEYWFAQKNEKIKKTVYYFLMEYESGNIHDHDWEIEDLGWFGLEEVEKKLTYPSDKKVWGEARKLITKISS